MLASSENSEINFSEMESSSINLADVIHFDLLKGDTGLRSLMEIAQNLSARGDALTHNSMLNELFLMYSKEMVLQQSSNNQTIHDRLLSVIKLAISREYMLMDQVIGKTRTFKMTTRGLFVSLEKILSTEVFSERLSRMAESFLESSRVSTDPGRNTELKHSNQNYSEITRPGRTQKINVDSQIDDAVGEEKEKSNQANITDESIKSRINDIDTKVEQEIAIVSQNMHFGSIADETSSLQKNCKRTDSAGSISVQSDTDSPRDSEDHMSKNARMRSDREKRALRPVEQISITTGKTVRYYPSLRDAARAMDIRLSDLSQCLKSNNNKKSGNFYWKFSKDYNEENTQDLPPLESLLEIRRSTAKIATSASSSLLSNVEDADKAEDLQGPSALLIVSHTRKRSMEKHTDLAATAPKKKMSSVRSTSSAPLPPRTEQSAVSRPTEPITGQTYELLILAAMSKMSSPDDDCSWHPSDVTLKLVELFPQLLTSSEISQQFRQILSYERILSSTLRAASAGSLGCDYYSSEGVEDECRYRLTSQGRQTIEFFSVFNSSYRSLSSMPTLTAAPAQDNSVVIHVPPMRTSSLTTSSSSSSLHYDSDDIQYFDADILQPNVGEKRKLSSPSSEEETKRYQPSDKNSAGQESVDSGICKQYQGKSVEQRNLLTGQLIKRFKSLSAAADATGVSRKKISECCAGGVNDTPYLWTFFTGPSDYQISSTTKSAIRPYGKRLSFPPDYFSNSRPADATTSSSTARARGSSGVRDKQEETQTQTQTQGHTQGQGHVRCVKQFHPLTGTLLHVYPSLKAAGKAMRAQWTQDLSKCCLGFSKTSAEFVWRYSARTMTGNDNDGLPSVHQLLQLKSELSERSYSEKREAQLRWTKVDGIYKFTGDVCSADKCGEEDEDEVEEGNDDGALKEKEQTDGQIEAECWTDRRKKSEPDRSERDIEVDEVEDVDVDVDDEEMDVSDSSSKEDESRQTSPRPPPRVRRCTLPKPVEQLDPLSGVVLRRYESQKHATRIMKLNSGMIAKCFANPALITGNFRWRESKIPSSKTWNMGSKPIRDLLRIRYGTENIVRSPKSKVPTGAAVTGDRNSKYLNKDGIVRIIKLENVHKHSVQSAGEDRGASANTALDADPSRAIAVPSTAGGDQGGGEEVEECGSETMERENANRPISEDIDDFQEVTDICWADDIDEEGPESQSEREMKEFWENRFIEQGAREKRLREVQCTHEVMGETGEVRLKKAESRELDEGLSGCENSGEEMDEE